MICLQDYNLMLPMPSTTQQMRISANGRTDLAQPTIKCKTYTKFHKQQKAIRCSDTVTSNTHTHIQFLRGGTQVGKIECAAQSSTSSYNNI